MVAIGTFDGVHVGHQAVIRRAIEIARVQDVTAMVLTFEPQPIAVLRPELRPAVLTHLPLKTQLIERLGVDELLVVPFTKAFARIRAERFAEMLVSPPVGAETLVVGENFRFGHRAAGDVPMLRELGDRFGFATEGVAILGSEDATYSSTFIRSCIDAGDVAAAARALGREHRLEGVVVRGDMRGRELGYPTANLETGRQAAVPADGVYAGRLAHAGRSHPAAVSIGSNPTFDGRERRVEAYLLDFDGDLYGERVALDFVARLRGMERFDTVPALQAQMALDVEQAGRLTR